ncbi:MAG TPA: serine/threonine-protein kinase [Nannocystaceae bacterium]|nr:serine/threonine-protein kinase [Nannocystaceae bacterium]
MSAGTRPTRHRMSGVGASDDSIGERSPAMIEMDLVQAQVHERLFGEPARAVKIGRFEVLSTAGAGGMGVVFVAADPELGRQVAIKLVSPSASGSTSPSQTRLLAEAQTLARLSHPNIVGVHEVGTHEGRIFVAMEHIDGETLERWLGRSPRPRAREILRAFVQAGHGLAAAHRAGVVHGDFKPSNVMIDRAGRVRVLDFGLAIAQRSGDSLTDTSVTPGRTVVSRGGTPLFMALEQWDSQPATARSDQYSFCVSLWTALFGAHPFAGHDEAAMIAAMRSASVPHSRARGVPGWLARALRRGLDPAPALRWPSMDALVDALEHGPARMRRRRALQVLAAAAAIGLVVAGARALEHRRAVAACAASGDELAATWEDARASVHDAIMTSGVSYAATTAEKLPPHLDAYAEDLRRAGHDACMASTVDAELDPELYARARACLGDRHDALAVLLSELDGRAPDTVRTAVTAALRLPDVDSCVRADQLASRPQPPADAREEVRAVRAELVRAEVLKGAGRTDDALAVIDRLDDRARAIGWAPLTAELAVQHAEVLQGFGREQDASLLAYDAYVESARVGAWDVAARAATMQLSVVGFGLGRYDEAKLWNQLGELAEIHAGQPDSLLTAGRLEHLSVLENVTGDGLAGKGAAERSLAIAERVLGPDNPRIARSLTVLADAHISVGEYDRAKALYQRSLAITVEAFGDDHPHTGRARAMIGVLAFYEGDVARAHEQVAAAVAQLEQALGLGHPMLAAAWGNLANLEMALGQHASARARIEQSLPWIEQAYGPEHREVATALSNLGNSYWIADSIDAALVLFERALEIEEKALGPRHPNVAKSLSSIANVYHERGRTTEALALHERALAIDENVLGPNHPDVGTTLRFIAAIHRDRGDPARALPLMERAVAILEAKEGTQVGEANAEFLLAQLLVETGGDRARAIALAERALVGYEALKRPDKVEIAKEWLAKQREEPAPARTTRRE